jgi:hypothetical protein
MRALRHARRLLAAAAPLLLAAASGCRYDPVPQALINSLGPEHGTPNELHRPGQPCLACHSPYQGATPLFAIAGTVFTTDKASGQLVGLGQVLVQAIDSNGEVRKKCTNSAGNFFVAQSDWMDIEFPLRAEAGLSAGGLSMQSLIGRDGSCATCHKLPDSSSLDMVTGKSQDSAGVILVPATAVDPTDCPGTQ